MENLSSMTCWTEICYAGNIWTTVWLMKHQKESSHVTLIYIALFTIQIVSK